MIPIKLPREQKKQLTEQMKRYFEHERGEAMGDIAAEQTVDDMMALLGPYMYNQALEDARKLITERMMNLEDDLYALHRPLHDRG
ncbi:DUF2164 domain-containing protein [Paenibacillus apiarius]|uniref:DUF2164 domain-containing protein n=1 Tax=Paenibacillus apiarius TaxID=46240 RepID=A0ABT4DMT0_9BACL|nr:DUF2164 domain-containing protein [Paenibacillus apiarius]MCY9514669.1 DUF2164 domain-containing protein [Paenibacillus apiarius]MCY9518659.1 DUF2164 domain-containing protein [Paenibacillus apiarius]MCY9552900.1 DUF2164 domain-containing protein [Paenibacillus apiarius]MCY9556925.1 DUF2164 domain-containing protein [Paenibacillus apiarius]MCY9686122.1 DUF2164 domain-containing protein [Paenibacillus apiarius]